MNPLPNRNDLHSSITTRPCAQWGPASPTSTMKSVFFQKIHAARFLNPCPQDHFSILQRRTKFLGTSPCRMFSPIFNSVDVLTVATIAPLLSTFAIEHNNHHSTLIYSVTLFFFSHLSSFPTSVTDGFCR